MWIEEAERDLPDKSSSQWAFLKHKIGEFSRAYGAKIKKAKLILKENLEKELNDISQDLDCESKIRYQSLKSQLDEIIENEIKGSVLRSLCRDYEEGEKCSKYFFNLEKCKAAQKTITCIRGSNGGLVTDQNLILEECRLFYKKLYTKNKDIEKDSFERFTSNSSIPKLDKEAQMKCEQELSEQELFSTLKAFKKNKSPGLDGLTAEFYLEFWEALKTKLLEVYKEAYLSGTLPDSMTKGVIVLLEKKRQEQN